MWPRAAAVLSLILIVSSCGKAEPQAPEPPEHAASRIFQQAETLAMQKKTKEAMAAYRQIIAHFPSSPEAKTAASRIQAAQNASRRKPAPRRPADPPAQFRS